MRPGQRQPGPAPARRCQSRECQARLGEGKIFAVIRKFSLVASYQQRQRKRWSGVIHRLNVSPEPAETIPNERIFPPPVISSDHIESNFCKTIQSIRADVVWA